MATKQNVKKVPQRPAPRQAQAQPTRPPERQQTSRELVKQVQKMPSTMMAMAEQDSGKGVSTDQSDNLIPLIYILQANSPPAMKGHVRRIEGAEAGSIWLRNAAEPIIDGEQGMLFQHCFFSKDWVEWQPNRGGFVGRHPECPENAEQVDVEGDDGKMRKVWRLRLPSDRDGDEPSGNIVVETRYHVGHVIREGQPPLPYTIPFSSTGHTVSKGWMFSMNGELLPSGKKAFPGMFLYRLKTFLKTKDNNSWYMFDVSRENDAGASEYLQTVEWGDGTAVVVTEDLYRLGRELHDAFAAGVKQVAEETGEEDTAEESDDRGDI